MVNENCLEINNQINRIKGQIAGIEKMIDNGRDAMDIIQQISAVRSALSRLGTEILKEESAECFREKSSDKKLKKFEKLVSNFFKLT